MGNCYGWCGSKDKHRALSAEKRSIQNTTRHDSRQSAENIKPVEAFHASRQDFIKNKSSKLSTDYEIKGHIGTGSYGEVKIAIDRKTGEERAIKIMRRDLINPKEYGTLMEEVKIIDGLDHPNIMKLYDVYEDTDRYYIVSEYLRGGELFDRIIESKHLSEQRAARIMRQVLSAVAYCHNHGVVHRDLKPENILFETKNDDNVKIIDFGFAELLRPNHRLHGLIGTSCYLAPEVANNSDYTEKCDVWSCGVILYVMLSGYSPFDTKDDDDDKILRRVKSGKYDFNDQVWNSVSSEAKAFIQKMMEYDPGKRISADQALQDPWLIQYSEPTQADQPLAKLALDRLSSFRVETKLQETIWIFLVSFFSSTDDIHKLWQAFKALDTNNDGQLTREELIDAYVRIDGFSNHRAEEEADRIFRSLDSDHDGRVNYSEFLSAAASRKIMLTKDHLERAFKIFDKDGDGQISADDLRTLFNSDSIRKFPSDLCQKMIAEVDKNSDGRISFEEFTEMMGSLLHHKNQQEPNIAQNLPAQGQGFA